MLQVLITLMVMERSFAAASKMPANAACATVSGLAKESATSPDYQSLPQWSLGYQLGNVLSWLFGSPFAIAVGKGANAHSNGGGAVAMTDGGGAQATAVSNGGYAEAVALGPRAQSSATANQGQVKIDRMEVTEDGQIRRDNYASHF